MTRDEFLRILNAPGRQEVVSGADAQGVDLRAWPLVGIAFENVDFSNAALSDCDFDSSSFVACTLDGVDLTKANLYKATFSRCSLKAVKLRAANLRRSNIQSCSLATADLCDADFTRATCSDLDLRGADLTGAIFFETVIRRVRAHDARGVWLRPGDNSIEGVDMSANGDGSDLRDGAALIDRTRGRPRPIRARLCGTPVSPVIVREEPNAPEREIEIDSLPIDAAMRNALRAWAMQRDAALLEPESRIPAAFSAIDDEGRQLLRSLISSLADYHIDYEPAQEEPPASLSTASLDELNSYPWSDRR